MHPQLLETGRFVKEQKRRRRDSWFGIYSALLLVRSYPSGGMDLLYCWLKD